MALAGANGLVMDRLQYRIGHVITQSGPFAGAQRNTLLTLKGLVRDGYEAELICGPGGPLIQKAKAIGAEVHVIPNLVRRVDPLNDLLTFFRLYRLFRSRKYEIVHTHSTKAGFLGRLAAWVANVPVIVHTHHGVPFEINGDLKSRIYISLERLVGPATDCMVCVGEVLRQELLAWKIAASEKLTTIYSGIDFSSYVPKRTASQTKRELGLERSWPIIGSVGRLSEQKAQYYLVESIALLRDHYPQIKLLLVGEGDLRSLLERRIQDLGLSANVSLLGERDDIADLLKIFDVYAMSSRWEGVGRALTEAMYWGLPVVATSVNGVKELIIHEETGLLVPPHDPSALASVIDRLVSDPELASRLGSNAHKKARALMDGEHMITAVEELYERLKRSKHHKHLGVGNLGKNRGPAMARKR
jgi:glycosyltransferase involved in cell wall biosynthesis